MSQIKENRPKQVLVEMETLDKATGDLSQTVTALEDALGAVLASPDPCAECEKAPDPTGLAGEIAAKRRRVEISNEAIKSMIDRLEI